MKVYLMRILAAVLICVLTDMILTEKWSKYVKMITGLIIISAIASPLEKPLNLNFKEYFAEAEKFEILGEEYTTKLIKDELEITISNDINSRILVEFGEKIQSEVSISLNDENKISGVERINLIGSITQKMIDRINEIYAPKEVFSNGF